MKPGEENADSLIQELNQETENANNTRSETKVEPTPINDEHFEEEVQPVQPKPEAPAPTQAMIRKMAASWVNKFNTLIRMIFTPIYKMKILEEGDIEKIAAFRKKNPGLSDAKLDEAIHNDSEMWPVVNRMDKFMKVVKEVPFTEEEKEDLIEPLAQLIEKYKKLQLGPEWMLAISVFLVMLPRIEPLFPNISKFFTRDE